MPYFVQPALRVTFVWWLVPLAMKVVWKSATKTSGALFVIWAGVFLMPEWLATMLDTLEMHQVRQHNVPSSHPI